MYSLVTGAGGTIGSELCRQLPFSIALGHGETSLYHLDARCVKVLADVRDIERLREVFRRYPIHRVYHVAAHKHVRFGEKNPFEFVQNNVIGTQNLLRVSAEFDVKSFVFMSTDKAVEPRNVMGLTKRMAEMLVLDQGWTVVRSGNVAWSRGSVLPHWKQQIGSGGPLTLTDPRVRRYFIQKERLAKFLQVVHGNHIFIPAMREYRMLDIARAMIGDRNINIEITGLTPGEKLEEKLWYDFEHPIKGASGWMII